MVLAPAPRVSVYIPTKNRRALLLAAVRSVLEQSEPAIEVIVVDDGSNDGTFDLLVEMSRSDPRVRPFRNERSLGAPACRNRAIDSATGEFVTGLDDDDRFHPMRVEAFLRYWSILEKAGEQFSCLFSHHVSETVSGSAISTKPGSVYWEDLFYANGIGNQVFARRVTFVAAGLFDADMPAWQDMECFIRLLKHAGTARLLDAALYYKNTDERTDRISVAPRLKLRAAYRRLVDKWPAIPAAMRQALYLQMFNSYYGLKPQPSDLVEIFRHGIHVRNLKTLMSVYLKRG